MPIQGVDISGLQNAFSQLAQSNALVAQRELEERRRREEQKRLEEAQRARNLQTLGAIAGAVGGAFTPLGPVAGSSLGSAAGGLLGGQAPDASTVMAGAQAFSQVQAANKATAMNQLANEQFAQAVVQQIPDTPQTMNGVPQQGVSQKSIAMNTIQGLDTSLPHDIYKQQLLTSLGGQFQQDQDEYGRMFQRDITNNKMTQVAGAPPVQKDATFKPVNMYNPNTGETVSVTSSDNVNLLSKSGFVLASPMNPNKGSEKVKSEIIDNITVSQDMIDRHPNIFSGFRVGDPVKIKNENGVTVAAYHPYEKPISTNITKLDTGNEVHLVDSRTGDVVKSFPKDKKDDLYNIALNGKVVASAVKGANLDNAMSSIESQNPDKTVEAIKLSTKPLFTPSPEIRTIPIGDTGRMGQFLIQPNGTAREIKVPEGAKIISPEEYHEITGLNTDVPMYHDESINRFEPVYNKESAPSTNELIASMSEGMAEVFPDATQPKQLPSHIKSREQAYNYGKVYAEGQALKKINASAIAIRPGMPKAEQAQKFNDLSLLASGLGTKKGDQLSAKLRARAKDLMEKRAADLTSKTKEALLAMDVNPNEATSEQINEALNKVDDRDISRFEKETKVIANARLEAKLDQPIHNSREWRELILKAREAGIEGADKISLGTTLREAMPMIEKLNLEEAKKTGNRLTGPEFEKKVMSGQILDDLENMKQAIIRGKVSTGGTKGILILGATSPKVPGVLQSMISQMGVTNDERRFAVDAASIQRLVLSADAGKQMTKQEIALLEKSIPLVTEGNELTLVKIDKLKEVFTNVINRLNEREGISVGNSSYDFSRMGLNELRYIRTSELTDEQLEQYLSRARQLRR